MTEEARLQWGKYNLFTKWCWKNWTDTCKRMKVGYFLTPYIRINTKWIKDLNVRPKAIKVLEENIGSKLFNITFSNVDIWIFLTGQGKQKKKK